MQRILGFGIAILCGACSGDDDTTSTSFGTNGETGMTVASASEATLSSDATIDDTSSASGSGSSEAGSSSVGDSSSEDGGSLSVGDSSSDGGSDTSTCEPITDDASGIGTTCEGDLDCPDGYTCYDGGGIASMPMCQVLCTQDCDCPAGHTCEHMNIKGNEWDQCNPG